MTDIEELKRRLSIGVTSFSRKDVRGLLAGLEAAERDGRTLASFAKTAPGRLPSAIQQAVDAFDAELAKERG